LYNFPLGFGILPLSHLAGTIFFSRLRQIPPFLSIDGYTRVSTFLLPPTFLLSAALLLSRFPPPRGNPLQGIRELPFVNKSPLSRTSYLFPPPTLYKPWRSFFRGTLLLGPYDSTDFLSFLSSPYFVLLRIPVPLLF